MKIDCALLCDAATVREGLLHVIGGGVTRLNRAEFPAPMGVALALRVVIHQTEAGAPHVGVVMIQDTDGLKLFEARFDFKVDTSQPSDLIPGEEMFMPLVIPLMNVGIGSAGPYSIEILIDGIHQVTVPFRAIHQGG